ncbi:hypothetical protein GCK72_012202 [Caenorhabditis remanei]|uniref:Uncharacterized protein n=1 Tax=Caenorhabditis remanei TaxID=31234 RepID=A0A6A5GMK8_CAERE|nr:hypothetical protein GCK72_012202 [Caenorhabditis remanei]KAF1755752.1 hypothetical protein GCK72_012202 [Caenorhabditis remanei]
MAGFNVTLQTRSLAFSTTSGTCVKESLLHWIINNDKMQDVAIQIAALCLFVSYATSILVISLDKFYLLYNAISDLYAGINPYLLWIFSDSLRKYILIRIGFRKKKKGPSSSVLTVVVH